MVLETLEIVVQGVKIGGIIMGGSVASLGLTIGGAIGINKLLERNYLVNQLMPLYENGELKIKPTTFNVYRIMK